MNPKAFESMLQMVTIDIAGPGPSLPLMTDAALDERGRWNSSPLERDWTYPSLKSRLRR